MSGQISVGRTSANFQNRFARLSPVFDCAKSAFKNPKKTPKPPAQIIEKREIICIYARRATFLRHA
jgi:hypothetical protein